MNVMTVFLSPSSARGRGFVSRIRDFDINYPFTH